MACISYACRAMYRIERRQLDRASSACLCRTKSPGFEPQSEHKFYPNSLHRHVSLFAPLLCLIVLRKKPLRWSK